MFLLKFQKGSSILKRIVILNTNITSYFSSIENKPLPPITTKSNDSTLFKEKKYDFLKNIEKEKTAIEPKKNSVSNVSNTFVFAQYLPLDWNENSLKKHFDPKNEYITKIVLVKNRLGVYKGKALVEFISSEVCEKFINKWHENFIESSDTFKKIVFKSMHLKTSSQKAQVQGGEKQVYIYNIDPTASPDDIYSIASNFGEITKVQFPIHEGTKKHKGYGFITFKLSESARKFLEFADGKEFFGKTLR